MRNCGCYVEQIPEHLMEIVMSKGFKGKFHEILTNAFKQKQNLHSVQNYLKSKFQKLKNHIIEIEGYVFDKNRSNELNKN